MRQKRKPENQTTSAANQLNTDLKKMKGGAEFDFSEKINILDEKRRKKK